MDSSTLINICIIPSANVSQQCNSISQSLESDNTMFVLGRGKFAHMTIYMARFPNEVLTELIEIVEKALQTISAFRCQHTGYFLTSGRYLEASYDKSAAFLALHEQIIQQVSGLRLNPGQPFEESYFSPYTAAQKKNAEQTGYDLARELYRPHITLTRYKENSVPDVFPTVEEAALSFQLSTIGVYKADENGAVYEELRTFSL